MRNTNARKMKQKKQGVNPLVRKPARIRAPVMSFDGTILNGSNYTASLTTVANVAAAVMLVDASATTAVGPPIIRSQAAELAGITTFYQEFKYLKSAVQWIPQVAPGVADGGSRVTMCYVDNAETMAFLNAAGVAALVAFAKTSRTAVTFNAWEHYKFNVPLSNRRKTFDVNNSTVATNVDIVDRSIQGMVIVIVESVSAAATIGQLRNTYSIRLAHLNTTTTT
uniref:Capsid protein n=1 Tax=Apple tombus-like virus 1 TaxID=2709737 RepID=A0A6C0X1U0_9TOMB|nr:MAG: capsid protein [Apple tombus-like virus 1]